MDDIAIKLGRMDSDRMKRYTENLQFYNGKQWQARATRGEKQLTINYSKALVDKVSSYLMAGYSFAVDPADPNEQTSEQAAAAERLLYQVHDENDLAALDFVEAIVHRELSARFSALQKNLLAGRSPGRKNGLGRIRDRSRSRWRVVQAAIHDHRLTVGILREPLALDTTRDLRAVLPRTIRFVAAVLEVDACRLVYAAAIRVVVPAAVRAVAVGTTRMLDLAFNDIGA